MPQTQPFTSDWQVSKVVPIASVEKYRHDWGLRPLIRDSVPIFIQMRLVFMVGEHVVWARKVRW